MPVTDDMVATVRAYLEADKEEFKRLNASLDRSREASLAYRSMILGTFITAVQRKFTEDSPREDIIDYVANLRSRGPDMPDVLDPNATERLIASVFTNESLRDIDGRMKITVQMHVATAIVNDEGIHGEALDAFLSDARKLANDLMS